jgi:hypothetical protein
MKKYHIKDKQNKNEQKKGIGFIANLVGLKK